jgi:hypothetical protein
MKAKSFPSALSLFTIQLDIETTGWIKLQLPSWDEKVFLKISSHRINWFSTYLYPQYSKGNLRWCMRFFICLFLLDDKLDQLTTRMGAKWLNSIKYNQIPISFPLELQEFNQLISSLCDHYPFKASSKWSMEWRIHWQFYLEGLEWEISNKLKKVVPKWENYWPNRIKSSGVMLALHLLKFERDLFSCEIELLENKAGKLICMSNDIISFPKESKIGDFHNGIALCQHYLKLNEAEAIQYHKQELLKLEKEIRAISSSKEGCTHELKNWLSQYLLLIGGCIYWSEQDTLRYHTAINGQVKY